MTTLISIAGLADVHIQAHGSILAVDWMEKPSGLGVPVGVLVMFWVLLQALGENQGSARQRLPWRHKPAKSFAGGGMSKVVLGVVLGVMVAFAGWVAILALSSDDHADQTPPRGKIANLEHHRKAFREYLSKGFSDPSTVKIIEERHIPTSDSGYTLYRYEVEYRGKTMDTGEYYVDTFRAVYYGE